MPPVTRLTPISRRRFRLHPPIAPGFATAIASIGLMELPCTARVRRKFATRSGARAGADVTAIDVSCRAVTAAWLNARINRVRLRSRRGSLLEPVDGEQFDVIA